MELNKMKPELEVMRAKERWAVKDFRIKALRVIDMLTTNDDFAENKLLSTIYRVAHSASGICGNPHEDWQEETKRLYRKLRRIT